VAAALLAGQSVREIAAAEGASRSTVGRDVQALRAEWAAARVATVELVTGEQLARLRAMLLVLWPKVINPEAKGHDQAIDRAARLIELQARIARVLAPSGALPELPPGTAGRISVEVVYARDWRSARNAAGDLEVAPVADAPALPAGGGDGGG
jgi:hypothetical protein